MYDVIIVGAGPAGLFAAKTLSENHLKVLIIDKGRDIEQRICPKEKNPQTYCNCNPCNIYSGLGGAGGKSDGKLNFHPKIGGNLYEYTNDPEKYINIIDQTFTDLSQIYNYTTTNGKAIELAQKALQTGQQFVIIKQKHIGSDLLFAVMQKFRQRLQNKNVEFKFLTTVKDIIVENNQAKGVITNQETLYANKIILAPGREGSKWFQEIATKNNIELTFLPIDIGVRVETLNEITKPITDIQYDPKIRMLYRDELVRNFCTNPEGFVVTENYGDYCLVNGHAEKNRKSQNCNFAVLYRVNLTKPRTNTSEYGKHIAQMFNYLGRKKPIVQRLADLKLQRRTTEERLKMSNVNPTLKDAIPGDITLAMPQKIIKGILKYLEKLDELMPGIYRGDNTLIYAPEIKFQAMRGKTNENLESSVKNLFFAGDGCGQTGGIVQAAVTGILAAEGILKSPETKKNFTLQQ